MQIDLSGRNGILQSSLGSTRTLAFRRAGCAQFRRIHIPQPDPRDDLVTQPYIDAHCQRITVNDVDNFGPMPSG